MRTPTSSPSRLWILSLALLTLMLFASVSAQGQESFRATHLAFLDGDSEVPAVPDGGQGISFMRLDPVSGTLEYRVSVALPPTDSITVAHFHLGAEGVTGPPIHPINFTPGARTATGTWTGLTAEQILALNMGGIYVNVHTSRNQAGQVRGQVGPIPNFSTLRLSPDQEVPPATGANGGGSALYWLDPVGNRFAYHIEWDSLTGPPTMAHFHRGAVGVAGPPVHTIPLPSSAGNSGEVDGVWTDLTPMDIADLFAGRIYVNFHTTQNQTGEIRGQVLKSDFYTAAISSTNEVPPASGSDMAGTGFVILTSDNELTGAFIVADGSGPIGQAHIHRGAAGVSGGVVFPLLGLGEFWVLPAQSDVSPDVQSELLAQGLYANFHTTQFEMGEARGQLIPAATNLSAPPQSVPELRPDGGANALATWYDAGTGAIRLRMGADLVGSRNVAALFSPLGEQIASVGIEGDRGAISVGALPAGIYFVQILRNGVPAGFSRVAIVR